MRVSLRTLLWLMVAAAIAAAWWSEHVRLAKRLAKMKGRSGSHLVAQAAIGTRIMRSRRANDLRAADEQELLQKFHEWGEGGPDYDDALYQLCLSKMLRRGLHETLREHYDKRRQEAATDSISGMTGLSVPSYGTLLLPFLTAVRRAEAKPDPVRIHLAYEPGASADEPPLIVPTLENVDVERQEIYLHSTGTYGERLNGNWQLRLVDESGRIMPPALSVESTGGFAGFRTLSFGEKEACDRSLDLRSYVRQPPPGRYQLQVLYGTIDIATDPELTGLIVHRAQPVEIIVAQSPLPPGFAVMPVLILLYAALLLTAAAIIVGRWRNSGRSRLSLISWRDAAAWVLLIALSLAWHHDIHYLSQQVKQSQLDEDADWTWRLAKDV